MQAGDFGATYVDLGVVLQCERARGVLEPEAAKEFTLPSSEFCTQTPARCKTPVCAGGG